MSFILLDTVGRHEKPVKLPCGLDTVQPPLVGIQTNPFGLIVETIFPEICVVLLSPCHLLWRSHNSRIDDLINYFWRKRRTIRLNRKRCSNIISNSTNSYIWIVDFVGSFWFIIVDFCFTICFVGCHQLLSIWVSFSLYYTCKRNKSSKCSL